MEKFSEFKPIVPYWKLRKIQNDVAHLIPLEEQLKKRPKKIVTSKILSYDEKTGRIETKNTIYSPSVLPIGAGPIFGPEAGRGVETASISAKEVEAIEFAHSNGIDYDFTMKCDVQELTAEEAAAELDLLLAATAQECLPSIEEGTAIEEDLEVEIQRRKNKANAEFIKN